MPWEISGAESCLTTTPGIATHDKSAPSGRGIGNFAYISVVETGSRYRTRYRAPLDSYHYRSYVLRTVPRYNRRNLT